MYLKLMKIKQFVKKTILRLGWNKGVNGRARDKDLLGNELPETSMAPLWSL